jgi:hypothetical protein
LFDCRYGCFALALFCNYGQEDEEELMIKYWSHDIKSTANCEDHFFNDNMKLLTKGFTAF